MAVRVEQIGGRAADTIRNHGRASGGGRFRHETRFEEALRTIVAGIEVTFGPAAQ
ncbi:hypothetical protein [Streptomyces sp. NBRC 110028]|uniref:hypothetical protein n=1 Tax=Streptomyces sp. NBRC 110028 TaxID=1621260 RepID=UPI000AB9BBC5|nr:hypothetical protein [Streptomyces sp. NBRC 110028]